MAISLLKTSLSEIKEIKKIRKIVFSDEMNIPESCLFDEDTVGTLRLRKENNAIKLERMAILFKFRRMSFGIKAIEEVKKYCITESESKIFLDSIYDVKDFYKKCGFNEIGKTFEHVGLLHIRMELLL